MTVGGFERSFLVLLFVWFCLRLGGLSTMNESLGRSAKLCFCVGLDSGLFRFRSTIVWLFSGVLTALSYYGGLVFG